MLTDREPKCPYPVLKGEDLNESEIGLNSPSSLKSEYQRRLQESQQNYRNRDLTEQELRTHCNHMTL
jgi:hypothetical protein